MGNSRPPYWTPQRLEQLRRLLDRAAQHDEQGAYFGAISLSKLVMTHGPSVDLQVSATVANNGLTVLVGLGILGPGRQGVKPAGSTHRRRYYPEMPVITESDLASYRLSVRQRKMERES